MPSSTCAEMVYRQAGRRVKIWYGFSATGRIPRSYPHSGSGPWLGVGEWFKKYGGPLWAQGCPWDGPHVHLYFLWWPGFFWGSRVRRNMPDTGDASCVNLQKESVSTLKRELSKLGYRFCQQLWGRNRSIHQRSERETACNRGKGLDEVAGRQPSWATATKRHRGGIFAALFTCSRQWSTLIT